MLWDVSNRFDLAIRGRKRPVRIQRQSSTELMRQCKNLLTRSLAEDIGKEETSCIKIAELRGSNCAPYFSTHVHLLEALLSKSSRAAVIET